MVSKFKKNIKLTPYTTFKIGGNAEYFFIAKTKFNLSFMWQKQTQSSVKAPAAQEV